MPPGLRTRFTSDSTCVTSRTEQSTCVMMTWSMLSSARPSDSPSRGSSSMGKVSPRGSVLLWKMGWKKLWMGVWCRVGISQWTCRFDPQSVQEGARANRTYVLGSMPMYDSMGLSTKHGALVAGPGLWVWVSI